MDPTKLPSDLPPSPAAQHAARLVPAVPPEQRNGRTRRLGAAVSGSLLSALAGAAGLAAICSLQITEFCFL